MHSISPAIVVFATITRVVKDLSTVALPDEPAPVVCSNVRCPAKGHCHFCLAY